MPTGERYTHGHHESVLRSHRWRTVENSAGYLIGHLTPGSSVLDLGCGPGTITADMAGRVAPGLVVGVDRAEAVLQEVPRSMVADAYRLPFGDGAFDIAHAHQVLQHLADPVAALAEMGRVGRLVAVRDSDYGAMTWGPDEPALDAWLALYRQVARANGGEPDAGSFEAAWAADAGLTIVASTTSEWRYESPEDRRWWADLWADRVTRTALGDRAVELRLCDRGGLGALADGWRRWAEQPGGWFRIPHTEVLARAA
jgi:SAM-dependent methyltransferase